LKFQKAKPVWAEGKKRSQNCLLGFRTVIHKSREERFVLSVACCTMYRVFVNNQFLAFGPARGPEGYFRIDSHTLSLKNGENIIALEVLGENCDTYSFVEQPAFLTCEITANGRVVSCTGRKNYFDCRVIKERVVNVQRYSYQRGFTEADNFDIDYDSWRRNTHDASGLQPVVLCEAKRYLERRAPYPLFEKAPVESVYTRGEVLVRKAREYRRDEPYLFPPGRKRYFPMDMLSLCVTDEAQDLVFNPNDETVPLMEGFSFPKNTYYTFNMGHLVTGFISFSLTAHEDVTLYCMHDELLTNGDIDYLRANCSNVIKLTFKKGSYQYMAFEPVCFKYIKFAVTKGSCQIGDIHMTEYKHPPVERHINLPVQDKELMLIYNAAVETFRHNAVDLYTDCPGRERAGWLCDSFFLGRVEKCLTGDSLIETNFLENYILPYQYKNIPEGMLPMCYPADFTDGVYIPNWAMWFVLQVEEYINRTGNLKMKESCRDKVFSLIEFLDGYLNEDGLLESLESWVFVEWSKANELTQDVNYPSNMLYAATLDAAGRTYGEESLCRRAKDMRQTIRDKSFNGTFFTDNAVRREGILANTNEATEVCQYYAFFFDIATPERYPDLWETLLHDFGPRRKLTKKHPQIHFANAFIGNYLRIDCLLRYGCHDKVIDNIRGYFYNMAKRTGTLWEYDDVSETVSCDHGFASYVVYWLEQIYGSSENKEALSERKEDIA